MAIAAAALAAQPADPTVSAAVTLAEAAIDSILTLNWDGVNPVKIYTEDRNRADSDSIAHMRDPVVRRRILDLYTAAGWTLEYKPAMPNIDQRGNNRSHILIVINRA